MSTLLGVFLVISSSATQQYGPPRATENHHDGRLFDYVDDDYGIEADQGIVKNERAITAEPRTQFNSALVRLFKY